MDINTNTMTAQRSTQTPSYFGMPACGHVSVWTGASAEGFRVKGDMGLATVSIPATFLGTSAWSPPTS